MFYISYLVVISHNVQLHSSPPINLLTPSILDFYLSYIFQLCFDVSQKFWTFLFSLFPQIVNWKKTFLLKVLLYYWSIDYDFSDHPVVLSAGLAPGKYCNSSAIPEPVTKNKLHMDSTKANYLMILPLCSKILRAEKVVSV